MITFKLDDSQTPGLAQVEIVKRKGVNILGDKLYLVRIVAIVKQPVFRRCRVGQLLTVSEKLLQEVK